MSDVPIQLTSGGDTALHFHSSDRAPTHDTLLRLQNLCNHLIISADYTVRYEDDLVMVTSGATTTLPLALSGKEFSVTLTDDTPAMILLTSPDLIYGESSVLMEQEGTSLRFKAITGGWIFI